MKRSRAPNFTTAEIMHLLRLVEKFPIIENKKTDGATARDKQEAWQNLTIEYNSQTKFSPRTAENLLSCYKNQKIRAKKNHSNENITITGPLLLNAMEEHGQDWDQVAQATKESSIDCQMALNQLVKEVNKEDASYKREINCTDRTPDHDAKRVCDFNRLNIMKKKGKKKNVFHSFQELADDKKGLVKAQRTLTDLQIQHQQLEIELAKAKLQFENKKNEMELDFLKEKYEIELGLLRNKKHE